MFQTLDDVLLIGFHTDSKHSLFPLAKVMIKKIKTDCFITEIENNSGIFHLQRPMNIKSLEQDDIDLFDCRSRDNNPTYKNIKFQSLDHCLQYLAHYTGYSLLLTDNYRAKDSSYFLTDLETSYNVIISKLDSEKNVVSEYYTPEGENCISIFLPEYQQNHDKKYMVEIRTSFGVIGLRKSDIEKAIDIEEYSYFFEDLGLLITTKKNFTA